MGSEREKPFANLSSFQLDTQLRELIGLLWLILPEEQKTVENLRKEVVRLTNRALDDFEKGIEKYGR